MKMYQVDAFTDRPFSGNPAAVCILERWLPDDIMLKLAIENNLSETAFAVGSGGRYGLRWFTPGGEVDLCGHATLATGFVILNLIEPSKDLVEFQTLSGRLTVKRDGDMFTMDFPLIETKPYDAPKEIGEAIGCEPVEAAIGYRDPIVLLERAEDVIDLKPDMGKVKQIPDGEGLFVTAPGYDGFDFVSRAFWPKIRIDEDPVCGSMHCSLADFWRKRLGKDRMVARQVSERGGTIVIQIEGNRAKLSGKAVMFATFEIEDSILE